ncbi:hypothetical protein L1887_24664 [Cichorium endivia]|nr:hypothetical protein L1887_24664 [Cichorium endivia]
MLPIRLITLSIFMRIDNPPKILTRFKECRETVKPRARDIVEQNSVALLCVNIENPAKGIILCPPRRLRPLNTPPLASIDAPDVVSPPLKIVMAAVLLKKTFCLGVPCLRHRRLCNYRSPKLALTTASPVPPSSSF